MQMPDRTHLALGLGMLGFAVIVALAWVPLDTATGMIEKVRRQVSIGDALAPTIAAVFIGLGGLFVLMFERGQSSVSLTRRSFVFLIWLLAVVGLGFALMRWTGPAVAALFSEEGYRPLRDTVPWKYLGFLIGGTSLVAGLITLIERRLTVKAVLIGGGAALVLIAVYDLPFDTLLLPPNGDV